MSEVVDDPERDAVVGEELACLARVQTHLRERSQRPEGRPGGAASADYEARLLDLRDQISSARMEDVPPLVQEMERLQSLMVHRRDTSAVTVDARSPYFGRLVIEEGPKRREVLIGRGTYLDTKSGVRIVDWRDAPVSRLYYRYEEGDDYDEVFGDREVTGLIKTRRSLSIVESELRRITSPQGTFVRGKQGFRRVESQAYKLAGGAGTAIRAEQHHRPGKLGIGTDGGEDKHLREITALIDPLQFDLITRSDAGLVVIQGGAGSGKTTIGLHRLAYLAFQDSRRFRPDKLLVIVFNDALARYVARVLPALGIEGVAIRTYEDWVRRIRQALYPRLPSSYREDTPSVVSRFKKHPLMLRLIDQHVDRLAAQVEQRLALLTADAGERAEKLRKTWEKSGPRPLAHRLHALSNQVEGDAGRGLPTDVRVGVERICRALLKTTRDVAATWAELLSDRSALGSGAGALAPGSFTPGELDRVVAWCGARSAEIVGEVETRRDERIERTEREAEEGGERRARRKHDDDENSGREDEVEDDDELRRGIDGLDIAEGAKLDPEDDTLLLRLHQRLRGPLTRGKLSKDPIVYEHILVDEAQDLSPVELSVVLDTTSAAKSITLSGDVQQRLLMDNGFSDWKTVLAELALSHVEVEPLKLSYRSTKPIIDFSRAVLGPLASADAPVATREGAPVDLFTHGHTGDAVATLSEALRELMQSEPQASVAVITRYPEQADLYFGGLQRAEVPYLRRVADQDFSFKAGVDVTDVRQVKGLEFDYVVIVEASESSYPDDDEARHLLHIAATRAAHQLWLFAVGRVSPLIPRELKDRSL
ncbi:MAG TPA: ATP-binding domain-containing protein [Polyangiaceae bacterium]|nr:ATP-binding domain-containing protein [Polyangiaceae bacterium]